MIQILGIRKFTPKDSTHERTYESFFDRGYRAPSVIELFKNVENYISKIPQADRYNLYYTCADCLEEKGRKMGPGGQSVMPFDVDGIDTEKRMEYIPIICKALGIDATKSGVLFSGNGLQFIVALKTPIVSNEFFDQHKIFYQAVCDKVNASLEKASLPGKMDTSVFSPARLMRLPLTENRKEKKGTKTGELYNRDLVPVDFDLVVLSGLPVPKEGEHIEPAAYKKYPPPDTEGVLDECLFLKDCKAHPEKVNEQNWYAMLSITSRLEDGNRISHEMSQGHPGYNLAETEQKIGQALTASGPRTCANIQKNWGGCASCIHFEKITSPILIKTENFIATQDNGFHNYTSSGKPGKPNYEDLRRYFQKQHPYVSLSGAKISYVWRVNHWEEITDSYLEHFSYKHFRPYITKNVRHEFRDLINTTNLRDPHWFDTSTHKKINFQNGILDLTDVTKSLISHDPSYGFRSVLPYNYDPSAQSPIFEKFIKEVCRGSMELEKILMEFAGYAFSNDECWNAKALILMGDGANGKSTFLNVMYDLAGADHYSTLSLDDLRSETARQMMDGKLFNASEETPAYSLMESSVFKNVVSGGEVRMRQMYKSAYSVRNRCKFIFACNDLPFNRDTSRGLYRRMLIVPFDAVFEDQACDPHIQEKLRGELPGIFNLVLEGYHRLGAQKGFTQSSLVDEQLEQYRKTSDTVEMFVDEVVQVHDQITEEKFSSFIKLYGAFSFYSEERGYRVENFRTFIKRLQKIIPEYKERSIRKRDHKTRERGLLGVTFDEITVN